MHVITLDYERAKEKVEVHYDGDAAKLITINRGGFLLDTAEQISSLIRIIEMHPEERDDAFGNLEIIQIANRFASPAETGYRDLKFYARDEDGCISVFRAVSRPYERETFFETSNHEWQLAMMVANTLIDGQGINHPYVLVKDNFLRDEPDSLHMVSGFSSAQEASIYGLSRFLGSLAELKKISLTTQDLVDNWILFGENTSVVLKDGIVQFDQAIEARLIDCDIEGMPKWRDDEGRDYFKAQILAM